jgi:choline dehydrogenase-like flavoprotein
MILRSILRLLGKGWPESWHFQISRASMVIKLLVACVLVVSRLISPAFARKIPLLSSGISLLSSLETLHRTEPFVPAGKELPKESNTCNLGRKSFDEIVVGSGPGGAIAAYLSSLSGREVLLIEEGRSLSSYPHHSLAQLATDFRSGGQEMIVSLPPIPYAQGQVLGGSSEINSGLYHRLPNSRLPTWLNVAQIDDLDWSKAEVEVESLIGVYSQNDESLGVYRNSPMKAAASAMGWTCQQIPRWRKYSGSNFEHRGMFVSLLANPPSGLAILSQHRAHKIISKMGANRVVVRGTSCEHTFFANQVTVSGGTVETPRLLVRSGLLTTRQLSFGFHAMSRVLATFGSEVNDLHDIDPHQAWTKDYSSKFGISVSTLGFLRATENALGVKNPVSAHNALVFYASNAMDLNGKFLRFGNQIYPSYRFSSLERARIDESTSLLIEGLQKSGARNIYRKAEGPSLSTVHIFGSLPLGKSSLDDVGTLSPLGYPSIRVCDASILPSAPLVNPQGPLMHLAYALTQRWLKNAH